MQAQDVDQEELVDALLGPTSPLQGAAQLVAQPVASLLHSLVDVIQGGASQVMRAMDLQAGGGTSSDGVGQGPDAPGVAGEAAAGGHQGRLQVTPAVQEEVEGAEAEVAARHSQTGVPLSQSDRQRSGQTGSPPSGSESDTESGMESVADFARAVKSGSEVGGQWEEVEVQGISSEPGAADEEGREEESLLEGGVGAAEEEQGRQAAAGADAGAGSSSSSGQGETRGPGAEHRAQSPEVQVVMAPDVRGASQAVAAATGGWPAGKPPRAPTSAARAASCALPIALEGHTSPETGPHGPQPPPHTARKAAGPHAPHAHAHARAHGGWRRLALAIVALRTVVEELWVVWGLDVTCLSLILAAFCAASVLSLACFGAAVLAAQMSPAWRLRLWNTTVIPFLSLSLIYEYCMWVGLQDLQPPALGLGLNQLPATGAAGAPSTTSAGPQDPAVLGSGHRALLRWLGLVGVKSQVLWALFLALCAVVMQAQADRGATNTAAAAGGASGEQEGDMGSLSSGAVGTPTAGAAASCTRGSMWLRGGGGGAPRLGVKGGGPVRGVPGSGGDLEAPLLQPLISPEGEEPEEEAGLMLGVGGGGESQAAAGANQAAAEHVEQGAGGAAGSSSSQRENRDMMTLQGAAARPARSQLSVFAPLDLWQRHTWGLHDWARYLAVKHSLDVLLVRGLYCCCWLSDVLPPAQGVLLLVLCQRVMRRRWAPFNKRLLHLCSRLRHGCFPKCMATLPSA